MEQQHSFGYARSRGRNTADNNGLSLKATTKDKLLHQTACKCTLGSARECWAKCILPFQYAFKRLSQLSQSLHAALQAIYHSACRNKSETQSFSEDLAQIKPVWHWANHARLQPWEPCDLPGRHSPIFPSAEKAGRLQLRALLCRHSSGKPLKTP